MLLEAPGLLLPGQSALLWPLLRTLPIRTGARAVSPQARVLAQADADLCSLPCLSYGQSCCAPGRHADVWAGVRPREQQLPPMETGTVSLAPGLPSQKKCSERGSCCPGPECRTGAAGPLGQQSQEHRQGAPCKDPHGDWRRLAHLQATYACTAVCVCVQHCSVRAHTGV